MDERDLLALLHRGGRALRTVRLVGTSRTDHEAVWRAQERWQRTRSTGSQTVAFDDPGDRSSMTEERTRLWIERPDRLREEMEGPRYYRYGVVVGDTWWMFTEDTGAITNDGARDHRAGLGDQYELLLEPAPLLPAFDFELRGEAEQAGRHAVRVNAYPRPEGKLLPFLPPLPIGFEDCELLVDVEHGTLLRLTALLEGEPGVDVRIDEIAYDEPIPAERFVFEPPRGETIGNATDRWFLDEPIEDIAGRASFTVWVATGLEGVWNLRAMHLRPRRGQSYEQVHLHYSRDDAARAFEITEQRADAQPTFVVGELEEIERNGEHLQVTRGTDRLAIASVRLRRDGTSIELTSQSLALERLLEIVDGLRPAPR